MAGKTDLPDINVMVLMLGPDYRISDVNPEVLVRTGLTRDELLGCHLETFESADHLRKSINQPLLQRIRNFEFTLPDTDGARINLEASAVRSLDENGNHESLKIVAYDISPRTTLLKEHNEIVRELEHTKSELQNFAHLAAEDLGGPLKEIASLFEVLRHDLCGSDELEINMFEQARTHTLYMHEKIRGLMELSLIDISPEEYQLVNLKETVQHLKDKYADRMSEGKGEFEIGALEETIHVCSADLGLILEELVDNSIKFSNPDVPLKLSVWSEFAEDESRIELFLRDNGLGMPPLSQIDPRLPFVRLHQNSGKNGLGIGLTRCSRLVRKFPGELSIESSLGHGTTVKLALKVVQEPIEIEYEHQGSASPLRSVNERGLSI